MRENINTNQARQLRKQMTNAEKRLWYLLRDRRFAHVKFRRQYPIGNYVCDFVCIKHNLVIEVDGSQHIEAASRDAERTAYLNKEGYTVLRFWNDEVLKRQNAVLSKILDAIAPHPAAA